MTATPSAQSTTPAPLRGATSVSDTNFNIFVLVAFLAVATLGALTHDMWRDEMQAWLIARDSPTPWAIIKNLRYEGHPALWYFVIWPVSQLTWSPDAMKPLSLAASTGGVVLFLWHGPWSRVEKLLWPFGYFVLFEYTIKSRSYCLGVLLLMLFCALWPARRQRTLTMALVLGLMANVHLFFGVLAAAGVLAIAVDRLATAGWRGLFPEPRRDCAAIAIFVGLAGFAATVAAPPETGDWSVLLPIEWRTVLVALGLTAIPATVLPDVGVPVHVAVVLFSTGIAAAIMVMISLLLAARRSPPALAFAAFSLGVLLLLFYRFFPAGTHRAGLLLLAVVAGEWILRRETVGAGGPVNQARPDAAAPRSFLRAIMTCQAAIGLTIVWLHVSVPYSNGRNVAEYVRAQGWAEDPVAGLSDLFVTVCGYLQRPWCFYAERPRKSSYMVYDGTPGMSQNVGNTTRDELDQYVTAAGALGRSVTLVIPELVSDDPEILARHGFRRMRVFTGATDENYVVYRKTE